MKYSSKEKICRLSKVSLLSLFMSTGLVFGQLPNNSTSNSSTKFSESYDAVVKTVYLLPDSLNPDSIPKLEVVKLTPINEEKHQEMVIDNSGDFIETTLFKSTDEYRDWMTKPAKMIIDKNGAYIYKHDGTLFTKVDREGEQKESYINNKKMFASDGYHNIPVFKPVTESMIDEFQEDGNNVHQDQSNGDIVLRKGKVEIRYNYNQLSQKTTIFNNNTPTYVHERKFTRNAEGYVIPDYTIDRTFRTLSNGICVQKMVRTTYSNYSSSDMKNPANQISTPTVANATFSKGIKVYPTPTSDVINVDLPTANSAFPLSVKLSVIDTYNKTWLSQQGIVDGSTTQFNVSNLHVGLYSVLVEWNGQSKTVHFLKN
jgi:hypothetical protein